MSKNITAILAVIFFFIVAIPGVALFFSNGATKPIPNVQPQQQVQKQDTKIPLSIVEYAQTNNKLKGRFYTVDKATDWASGSRYWVMTADVEYLFYLKDNDVVTVQEKLSNGKMKDVYRR